jgi:hypothetical protein
MKWTPLNMVLGDLIATISKQQWSEDDVMEWGLRAMRKLRIPIQYESTLGIIDIDEYTGELPSDYELIELLAYKEDPITAAELQKIENDLGHDNDLYYTGFLETMQFISQYKPLRLAKSPFAVSAHCDTCANLSGYAEHEYKVYPNNMLKTTFKTGTICIAYRRYAKDKSGNYLVPDDEDYLEALRSYIMMRLWEYRLNMKEQGAAELFTYYARRWSFLRKSVNGKLRNFRTLDEFENWRQQENRLVRKERDYYSGFANRPEEDLSI